MLLQYHFHFYNHSSIDNNNHQLFLLPFLVVKLRKNLGIKTQSSLLLSLIPPLLVVDVVVVVCVSIVGLVVGLVLCWRIVYYHYHNRSVEYIVFNFFSCSFTIFTTKFFGIEPIILFPLKYDIIIDCRCCCECQRW